MQAELIVIGTELLLGGEIVDTNSPFLAGKLAEYGVNLYYISTVGDNLQRGGLGGVLQRALQRSDLIIMTGGLGPTDDDLSREMVSLATGRELVEDEKVWRELNDWFRRRYGGAISPYRFITAGRRCFLEPAGFSTTRWVLRPDFGWTWMVNL